MDLSDVMDALATRLKTISGLNAYPFPIESVEVPAAVVLYPNEITFDATYGRGMDVMTIPVVVLVGAVDAESTKVSLAAYCDGSGSGSIKQVLESGTYTAFDTVRVVSIQFGQKVDSDVAYQGAQFELEIAGDGA